MSDTVEQPGTGAGSGRGLPPDAEAESEANGPDSAADDGLVADAGPDTVDDADDEPGRGRAGLVVSVVVAVLAVAFVVVLATREPASERRSDSPLIGEITPALTADTLDGGSFDIDDHRGQWVVVNFFATWCPPCVEEHPELVAFDEAHRVAGDATVVSVVYNDQPDDVREFFATNGGEWPVIADSGLAAVDYGVVGVPETYLVAPNGVVVQKYTGGVTQAAIDADIAALEEAAARSEEAS
jgi:cytochrome c biogenesis protein CcmG/thiol:disulfide interchange protein DsbE